jgi:hypothetical protein
MLIILHSVRIINYQPKVYFDREKEEIAMKYPDAETLIQKFQLTSYIIHRQAEGITNTESVIQPPVRGNCMNWILGHIVDERDYVIDLLKAERVFDDAARELYRRDSSPVTNLAEGLPFDQLMTKFDLSQERIEAGLQSITTERLAEMGTAGSLNDQVGALIAYIHWHESYHTGQFELLRQFAGKNDKVI